MHSSRAQRLSILRPLARTERSPLLGHRSRAHWLSMPEPPHALRGPPRGAWLSGILAELQQELEAQR